MNTEEKARRYDEALNWMREIYPGLHGATKEDAEHFFPELCENEDEMALRIIRKRMCYDPVPISDEDRRIVEHWLEKQKDESKAIEAVEKIDKYIDDHLANAHDMKDSNPDKKYYRGWDDALGKMAGILQDVYSNEKQKEQNLTLFNEPYNPDDYEVIMEGNATSLKKKEQKPAESRERNKPKESWLSRAKYEIEHADELLIQRQEELREIRELKKHEQKPAEWSEDIIRKAVKEVGLTQHQIDWFKANVFPPKQELSDEDDWKRKELIQYLEEKGDYRTVWMTWLKSLHPSWKPSEEQESVAEKFARIVRGNLIGIDKEVQQKFEQLYFEVTGNKMYGGYND